MAESADRLQVDPQERLENKTILSSDDFLIHMFGAWKSKAVKRRYYWNFTSFWDQPVKSLQFWAPIKTGSGGTRLRVSQQPFCAGDLYNGLCKYRRHCTENEDEYGELGPPRRAFRQQFPEYCPHIVCYSKEEFPARDYALSCGIVSNYAVPLFNYDEDEDDHCVGVLEFVSFGNFDLLTAFYALTKRSGFRLSSAHLQRCSSFRNTHLTRSSIASVLKPVREANQLPLIQVWGACVCDHDDVKLFCAERSCSKDLTYLQGFKYFNYTRGACYVKAGESLVGRAYSKDRPCFSRDTSQFHLSDYPFAHLTRSSGLAACFVIPLDLVIPTLCKLFLEIFLPPEHNHNIGNPATLLEPILSTLAMGFSKAGIAVGLKQYERFCAEVSYSGSEEIVYFDVKRVINTENTCSTEPSPNDSNARVTTHSSMEISGAQYLQNAQDTSAKLINLDVLESCPIVQDAMDISGEVVATITEDQVTLEEQHPNECDTNDSSEEVIATVTEDQITRGVPHPNEHDTTDSAGGVIAAMEGDQITPDVPYPTAHDTINSPGEDIAAMVEDQITLDVLKPFFGNNMNAAAVVLGVSRSTLKRRCRVLGIKRWPWHKRNIVKHIQSNPRLQLSINQNNATEKNAQHSQLQTKNSAADREAADDSVPSSTNGDRLYGKATYGGDTVMFPLISNSGIKELHRELNQRFHLQAEQFKIKYKYEDEWISILCDQDLHLGLEMIKSTGEKTINLSISPLSTS